MDTAKTTLDLANFFKQAIPESPSQIDTSKLRYAIYARKSTTGEERQERSIPDQIRDCIEKVAKPEGLRVVGEPIEEKCSAKEPGIRPKFTQLLDDIRYGKIDGIIVWHADRLSRNMKEAGEIIDLLDKGILKDLKFATSSFENSPTGKMLLGISFVLSKQYSEHLSESVTRGNRRKTEDGYFFDEMKHGYYLNDGRLYPDDRNFSLIQEAFRRRLEDRTPLKDIAEWLNTQGYTIRKKGKDPAAYEWNVNKLSKVFLDPTYAGVLKYGNAISVLNDFYDFTPVMSAEEYFKLNKVTDFTSAKVASSMMSNKRETTKADLLRGVVCCGYCGRPFSSGLTYKQRKDGRIGYYNYKCETEDCEFQGKSVRAGHILEHAYKFLDEHLFTAEKDYENFMAESREYTKAYTQDLTSRIMSLTKAVGLKQTEYSNAKEFVLKNPALEKHYNLDTIQSELTTLKDDLEKLTKQKANIKESVITYSEYLELFQNISVKLRNTSDMAVLDQVLRKFFSNFTVKQWGKGKQQGREVSHTLKEPWVGLLETAEISKNSLWSG